MKIGFRLEKINQEMAQQPGGIFPHPVEDRILQAKMKVLTGITQVRVFPPLNRDSLYGHKIPVDKFIDDFFYPTHES